MYLHFVVNLFLLDKLVDLFYLGLDTLWNLTLVVGLRVVSQKRSFDIYRSQFVVWNNYKMGRHVVPTKTHFSRFVECSRSFYQEPETILKSFGNFALKSKTLAILNNTQRLHIHWYPFSHVA